MLDGHAQVQTALLRSCLSVASINDAISMIDPSVTQQTWQDFDDDVSARLRRIWDLPNDPPALQNWQNDYAKLPERLGGLNIRSATIESRPAFISSVVRTQPTRLSLLGEDIKVPGFERALNEL